MVSQAAARPADAWSDDEEQARVVYVDDACAYDTPALAQARCDALLC